LYSKFEDDDDLDEVDFDDALGDDDTEDADADADINIVLGDILFSDKIKGEENI
jgi:hypothetical protein